MCGFARVFLQMDPGQTNVFVRHRFSGKTFTENVDLAVLAQGLVILADLIVLDKVRIKITLPVKFTPFGNFTAAHQTRHDRFADGFPVGDRKRTGIPHADRTGVGVGFSAILVRTITKHLPCSPDLDMHLQTDHGFISGSHRFSPFIRNVILL